MHMDRTRSAADFIRAPPFEQARTFTSWNVCSARAVSDAYNPLSRKCEILSPQLLTFISLKQDDCSVTRRNFDVEPAPYLANDLFIKS